MAAARARTAEGTEQTAGDGDGGANTAVAGTPSVSANATRIAEMLEAIAAIGADPESGISRLAFTPPEREAHALVGGWLEGLGFTVRQDAIGNTIAERAGTEAGAPAIGFGSHLDSVPHGGRFDGIVGVVGAVEAARLLVENRVQTQHPMRVVIFTAEEGARFGEPCIGSKAVVGALDGRDFTRMRDAQKVNLAQAMASVGMDSSRIPESHWNPHEWAAFLELHVEQARVLESEGLQIGLVDVVSGSTRLRITLHGRADHSGGTPMSMRSDALAAAAEVTLAAESIANDPQHRGTRATVGRLDVYPNSITTIPGRVTFTVDVRDVDSDRQRQTTADIIQRARYFCERRGVRMEVEVIADTSPAVLPMWLREVTSAVCHDLGIEYRVMTSGAGHDAQIINKIVPAGMIFVPSKDGLSHVPEEWTSAADIAKGTEVLYHSVLRLDGFLAGLRSAGAAA